MEETRYGLRVELPVPFTEAIERTTAALQREGFGVLTSIDVRQTLQQKLGRDFRPYVILGACNPTLADRALHAELEIGLLLPCNVIVYEREPGASTVVAMSPLPAMSLVGTPEVEVVAKDADARLRAALGYLERSTVSEADPATP